MFSSGFSIIASGDLFSRNLYVSIILPASSAFHASIMVRSANKLTLVKFFKALNGSYIEIKFEFNRKKHILKFYFKIVITGVSTCTKSTRNSNCFPKVFNL